MFIFPSILLLSSTLSVLTMASPSPPQPPTAGCKPPVPPIPAHIGPLPQKCGVLLFPAFQALDVFGPLDALNTLSFFQKLDLSIISNQRDLTTPISTKPRAAAMNPFNSNFSESVVATHTIYNPPTDLDVLLIPGGIGVRAPDLNDTIKYVKDTYPSLKYLITVCTGASIAGRAGILDGKRATTNKAGFKQVADETPEVKWVTHARWVVDGNVWTSAGVSAGIDLTFAFMKHVYGGEVARNVSNMMEYSIQGGDDGSVDAFAGVWGL